ncbi:MAG: ribonuclease H-like domain-containing protein [Bacteroidales bacterium]|nr:ribonuclease H-like domain-containing protein [Bacteroidales bacterium]MCM1414342.1 ribonuclease H-like domain-containing protein [bacterium]MCM1422224.1 ribonuclease H-like domain-containing protein [bacterium]
MQTITQPLDGFSIGYPLERIAPYENFLFVDIETTGFTAKSSSLYLIGTAFFAEGNWQIRQWFAENPAEEASLLDDFFAFAASFSHLIHFNGNNFDLPYLLQKCAQHQKPHTFDKYEGIDLYKRLAPYKAFLHVPNCKQKTLEALLGIRREDRYHGGELIEVYRQYVQNPTEEGKALLLLHNRDDMQGMLQLLPLLAVYDLFNGEIRAKKVQAQHYIDYHGQDRQEVLMKLSLTTPLPFPLSDLSNGCYFSGEKDTGILKVPLYEEEMKYFYANYKDYYYLPDEDIALHKSVSGFVDKAHRVQASASNCYTRKYGQFLPQWDIQVEPFFKRDYKSSELFFELTDERKTDRKLFSSYAAYLLGKMAKTY